MEVRKERGKRVLQYFHLRLHRREAQDRVEGYQ